jgi:SWIM zinc finger
MSFQAITYASPSAFTSTRERADLAMAANALRPVSFAGRVLQQHAFLLRVALRALGEAVWSEDHWAGGEEYLSRILDPVITVHPDRIWFEAFTQDLGAYASLRVDPEVFAAEGATQFGTTNIDFTAWLWGALGEMRSSRSTHFRVGAAGFEVATAGAGGRFEQKVELPDRWVRGFLQVQGAMALPGTRLRLRPVDLLAATRFLKFNKAKVSPRGLRYELNPGRDADLVVEPWEHRIPLLGAQHSYTEPRSIRTWGRRKLSLIDPLLPFAEHVDVYLKGRAMPSFYAVRLPGMTFLLGLTGTGGGSGFGDSGGFDLLGDSERAGEHDQSRVLAALAERFHATTETLAQATGLALADCAAALAALNRGGRVMYDVEARDWRHRELFAPPVDTAALFPPDPRREAAAALLAADAVQAVTVLAEESRKQRRYRDPTTGAPIEREVVYRQWRITGSVAGYEPQIVVGDEDRMLFGTCGCEFFKEHLMNKGPCPHMLALYRKSEPQRRDGDAAQRVAAA